MPVLHGPISRVIDARFVVAVVSEHTPAAVAACINSKLSTATTETRVRLRRRIDIILTVSVLKTRL